MLPIGQLPDAANAIAAAANARTLVRRCSAPVPQLAASSRWCSLLLGIGAPHGSFFPMLLCHGGASHKALRHGALASNKPHSAEKSTPVWLAVWRIWAGFANSQLRRPTFHSTYSYKCISTLLPPCNRCSDRRKSFGPSVPIAYATYVSPSNEAIAWPGAQVSDG